MRPRLTTMLVLLASAAGFGFAAVSTYDFTAHLDRQVHGVHCSFLPGMEAADVSGQSGCAVTLMSGYSSVLRENIWGGLPIALPAMSVFAFLFFWALVLVLGRRQHDARATGFLWLATLLPLAASVVMGVISLRELQTACKLCLGIYASSALAFLAASALAWSARRMQHEEQGSGAPLGYAALAASFALGVAFVGLPALAYAGKAPDFSSYVGSCGQLQAGADPGGVLVALEQDGEAPNMIEVMDPLCPSCRAFESRLGQMAVADEVDRQLLLFPLDSACNWMVDRAIHPGACSVSEAVLCAQDSPDEVLQWAFANQEAILAAAAQEPKAAERMVLARFPQLKGCLGSSGVKAKLNRALRWAVANQLQVLTPQIYVRGLRLCDEDTDLGLQYALPRLVQRARKLPEPQRAPEPQPATRIARARTQRAPTAAGAASAVTPGAATPTSARPVAAGTAATEDTAQAPQAALAAGSAEAAAPEPARPEPTPEAAPGQKIEAAPQAQPTPEATQALVPRAPGALPAPQVPGQVEVTP